MRNDEWVELRTVDDEIEANIIKDILETADIRVVIRSLKIRPYPVNIGKMGAVRLLVMESEIDRAEEILREYEGRTEE